nr:hypothetical transcript [Hymenolepis microstoma]
MIIGILSQFFLTTFNGNISVKTLKIIQTEPRGVQLFDVRNPSELVEENRLPGAVNIPLDDIEMAFTMDDADFQAKYGVPKPKPNDDNLVFSCQAGRRSLIACEKVQNLGYNKPLNLEGGFMEWKKESNQ